MGVKGLEARSLGGCEPPDIGAGNQSQSSCTLTTESSLQASTQPPLFLSDSLAT